MDGITIELEKYELKNTPDRIEVIRRDGIYSKFLEYIDIKEYGMNENIYTRTIMKYFLWSNLIMEMIVSEMNPKNEEK